MNDDEMIGKLLGDNYLLTRMLVKAIKETISLSDDGKRMTVHEVAARIKKECEAELEDDETGSCEFWLDDVLSGACD